MDLYEAINTRRSVRNFTADPVSRDVLNKLVQAGIEAPTGCNMQLRHFIVVDDPAMVEQLNELGLTKGAPAAIVICMDPRDTPYGEFWVQDASATMQNMLLAAVAEGLAGCWIEGQVTPNEKTLHDLLNVPTHLRVWSLMAVGTAAANPSRPPKPTLEEITHYNTM